MDKRITILVPTSPIPSHPSLTIIKTCLDSVHVRLPEAKIIVMADGIRAEQQHYEDRYNTYLVNLSIHLPFAYGNATVYLFRKHLHQVQMTKKVLETVETPLILFMEHDTFFLSGLPIDFDGILRVVESGELNMCGFHCHWEPWTLKAHEHLMLDNERHMIDGVPFVRTWQWSQRPHVARVDFYKRILSYFSPDADSFIEDYMVPIIETSMRAGDLWDKWKMAYYAPEGSIRRTWTDDGRQGDPKFPCKF